jgi:hypothetical protein
MMILSILILDNNKCDGIGNVSILLTIHFSLYSTKLLLRGSCLCVQWLHRNISKFQFLGGFFLGGLLLCPCSFDIYVKLHKVIAHINNRA